MSRSVLAFEETKTWRDDQSDCNRIINIFERLGLGKEQQPPGISEDAIYGLTKMGLGEVEYVPAPQASLFENAPWDEQQFIAVEPIPVAHLLAGVAGRAAEIEMQQQLRKLYETVEKLNEAQKEIQRLTRTVETLRSSLRTNVPYLRVFRLGAGLFSSAMATFLILIWTGISMPLNPTIAAILIPISIVFMIMAYVLKNYQADAAP